MWYWWNDWTWCGSRVSLEWSGLWSPLKLKCKELTFASGTSLNLLQSPLLPWCSSLLKVSTIAWVPIGFIFPGLASSRAGPSSYCSVHEHFLSKHSWFFSSSILSNKMWTGLCRLFSRLTHFPAEGKFCWVLFSADGVNQLEPIFHSYFLLNR